MNAQVFGMRYKLDIAWLNTLTKYPSIPTYHEIDPKNGRLLPSTNIPADEPLLATEKIDGTNARMVFLPDGDHFIGSREEILYAKGDFIRNPTLGIVAELVPRIDPDRVYSEDGAITVAYLEVYGGKCTRNSDHYTDTRTVSCRIFDVAVIASDIWEGLTSERPDRVSAWREADTTRFRSAETISGFAEALASQRVPVLGTVTLPTGLAETFELLKQTIQKSQAIIDGAPSGRPEGIVVRNADRTRIAKIRYEDYERTLRARSK